MDYGIDYGIFKMSKNLFNGNTRLCFVAATYKPTHSQLWPCIDPHHVASKVMSIFS